MDPVESRERLYHLLTDSGEPVEERIDRALELGVAFLDLPIGFFTRVEDDVQEIVRSVGDHPLIQPGKTCPLDAAYCRRTVEIRSPLAVQDADGSAAVSDAAVDTFDLGAYIGARIVIDGESYGTVCFADSEPRSEGFSDAESYFVELAARLVGQALERQTHERELVAREDEIDRKEEVYRAAVNASFDLVFQIDEEGRFTFVSSGIEDLLGYEPDEYIGEPFTSILPDEETVAAAESMYGEVMQGKTVQREYFPLAHRDEHSVLVDVRVTPLYAGEVPPEERTPADIVGIQGMARDARDRQRKQRLISVLNRVLRHNLRNEMTIISNYAEMLQRELTGEQATYARKIDETSDRLVTLSETARKLERNLDEQPELDMTDVVPIVTRAASQVAERYPSASITTDTPDSATATCAPRLETAVIELLDNAARHAGEDPAVTVSVRETAEAVTIRIDDDGPGLPEQEREVLVAGEETPLVHGSGFGLWLVHWIVQTLDGRLTVVAESTIEISLRRAF